MPPTTDVFRCLLVKYMGSLRWTILSSSISPLLQRSYAKHTYPSNGLIRDLTDVKVRQRRPSVLLACMQTLFTWPFLLIVQDVWITMKGAVKFYLCFTDRKLYLSSYLPILQVCKFVVGIDSDFNRYLCNCIVCMEIRQTGISLI